MFSAAMEDAVVPETGEEQIVDALENAQELYERYVELSRIADIVPDDPLRPVSYEPPPVGLHLPGEPTVSLI